jgi:hypothetical protein
VPRRLFADCGTEGCTEVLILRTTAKRDKPTAPLQGSGIERQVIFWSTPDMRQQRFQRIVGDVAKSLIAALFAASVEIAPAVAAEVPSKFNNPDFKGEPPPPPQVGSTIDPARFSMPTADAAGVQAGVTLTAYKGPMTITTPGAVIENVIINGTLTIAADNVTIRNCLIQHFSNWGVLSNNATNTRVEYCDIDGTGSTKTTGLGIGGGTNSAIIGCDIRGMVIGINMFGPAEIRDNYIHDLADTSSNPDDRHFDGIRVAGGQDGSVIEHNTISMPTGAGGTAAIFIKTEYGAIDGITVKGNLMYGDPSYTMYVESTTSPITNVTIEDNYVERGIYGYFNVVKSTPTMKNNVQWDNQKNPIPYPKR